MEDKKTLVIADDDQKIRDMLSLYFEKDFRVFCACDGVDALMLAVEHKPDLILLDSSMPILEGRTLCRKLKNYPGTKDIKVVFLSGRGGQNDRIVGFEAGADDYLEKPCALEYIRRSVEKCLR